MIEKRKKEIFSIIQTKIKEIFKNIFIRKSNFQIPQ